MKKYLPLLTVGWLCACSSIGVGPQPEGGYGVDVYGATEDEARRSAVSRFYDLFLSPAGKAAHKEELEKTTKDAKVFIAGEKKEKTGATIKMRAVVAYAKLGRALDKAGLVRPEGVKGKPKVLVSLREAATEGHEGRAAFAVRRVLLQRGYVAMEVGGGANGSGPRPAGRDEALVAARSQGAEIVVTGNASVTRNEDPALAGYGGAKATLVARVEDLKGKEIGVIEQEASAVDVRQPDAESKALDSVGELAGDKVLAALGGQFKPRVEFSVVVLNTGDMNRARDLITALRGLPPVAAVALDAFAGPDVKVRLFVEKMSAEQLTTELLRLKQFNLKVRAVEPDINYLEFSSGDVF